jgi:threonine dehydrogenase-like Zn-dependent dehydrogenase
LRSAEVLGAERIIAIETGREHIAAVKRAGSTDIINFEKEDVFERIREINKGEGVDAVIDCAGSAGHGRDGKRSPVHPTIPP